MLAFLGTIYLIDNVFTVKKMLPVITSGRRIPTFFSVVLFVI